MKTKNVDLRLGLSLALCAFLSCASIARAEAPVTIPIVGDVNSLIITEIEVGGELHRFLIDTGAGANFVSPEFVAKFNGRILKRAEKQDQTIANATEKVNSAAYTMDLKVGGLDFGSLLAFEQNTKRFTAAQDGIDCCSGILGIDFLKKFPVEINRAAKTIKLNSSLPSGDGWAKLPASSPNGRAILLQCKSSLGPETIMRLDTGSEVPLILQKRFIDKYSVVERVAQKASATKFNGLPVISFGTIKCSDEMDPVRIDALAYTGGAGALTHTFVDGNIGDAFLGRHYVLALAKNAIFVDKSGLDADVRAKSLGEGTEIELTPAKLDEHFRKLRFLPIQERIKEGLAGLSQKEKFAVGELLLTSPSASNEELAFKLLDAIAPAEVPCIGYYRSESAARKGKYEEALKELQEFRKTKPIACESETSSLFKCCPDSKHRNASGLQKLVEMRIKEMPRSDLQARLPLAKEAKTWKVPLVTWEGKTFLLDTGAEHHVWNTACSKELGLKIDSNGKYGGSDSVGEAIVASVARPEKNVLGLPHANLAGFATDLGSSSSYGKGVKLCGILSPQQVIPKGLMVFDWSADSVLLCQGDECRKTLEIPANCPMYMFNGRPYFNAVVNSEDPKLFLLDTGANSTSANLNYFTNQPKLERTTETVSGASQKAATVEVIPQATFTFCDASFQLKPFSVRPASKGWEWNENGKIGMNLLYDNLIAIDFGRGGALFK